VNELVIVGLRFCVLISLTELAQDLIVPVNKGDLNAEAAEVTEVFEVKY
jgi:hypothetical protein